MKNVLIAASVMGIAVSAPAAMAGEEFQIEFAYERSELTTAAGAEAVYERLHEEIEEACDVTTGSRDLTRMRMERQCIEETTRNAIQTINSHNLDALFERETGQSLG